MTFLFPRWFTQHEYIQKLNMQAVLDASVMHDETVKELLVSFGKVKVDDNNYPPLVFRKSPMLFEKALRNM